MKRNKEEKKKEGDKEIKKGRKGTKMDGARNKGDKEGSGQG